MNEAVIMGVRNTFSELADGTLRVKIDIDPQYKRTFYQLFGEVGTPVALAQLKTPGQIQSQTQDGGKLAQALYKCGFFYALEVCKALGTDHDFLEFIKSHDKSATGHVCTAHDQIVPAHVRRVANGSGTGIKPPYSAIPLLVSEHNLQHQSGESAIASREQWDKWRNQYLIKWCKEKMYQLFNIESLTELDKNEFIGWCQKNELVRFVPGSWR